MAGRGRRFADAGYRAPKPLILARGRPLVWWALQGLPIDAPQSLTFIVAQEQVATDGIDDALRRLFSPQVRIVVSSAAVSGQAAAVLQARDVIDNDGPIVIHNCDTHAPGTSMAIEKALAADPDTDGIIPVFHASDPQLSYVRVGAGGCVTAVAEKQVISAFATTGTYYFRRGCDFVWAADRMIRDALRVGGEYYVLPTYTSLIGLGMKIRIAPLDAVHVLGTPEELERFERQ